MAISMKMARVGANLTKQQIADKMGVHVQTYSKMENDPESMSIKDAKLFCNIVGISYSDIFFSNNSN